MSYNERGAEYHSIYDFIIVSELTIALTFHATFFCAYLLLIPTIVGKNDPNQMHLRQRTWKKIKKKMLSSLIFSCKYNRGLSRSVKRVDDEIGKGIGEKIGQNEKLMPGCVKLSVHREMGGRPLQQYIVKTLGGDYNGEMIKFAHERQPEHMLPE